MDRMSATDSSRSGMTNPQVPSSAQSSLASSSSRSIPEVLDDFLQSLPTKSNPSETSSTEKSNSDLQKQARAILNDIVNGYEADIQDLQQVINDLGRDNADLEHRIQTFTEDINDEETISEYAQYIADKCPASCDDAYVQRLQSSLCKLMHKLGSLSNQMDLLQQQDNEKIAKLRRKLRDQSAKNILLETQSKSYMETMEDKLKKVKQAHKEEISALTEEYERKLRIQGSSNEVMSSNFLAEGDNAEIPNANNYSYRDDDDAESVATANSDAAATHNSEETAHASNVSTPPLSVVSRESSGRSKSKRPVVSSTSNASSSTRPLSEHLVHLVRKINEVEELKLKLKTQDELLAKYEGDSRNPHRSTSRRDWNKYASGSESALRIARRGRRRGTPQHNSDPCFRAQQPQETSRIARAQRRSSSPGRDYHSRRRRRSDMSRARSFSPTSDAVHIPPAKILMKGFLDNLNNDHADLYSVASWSRSADNLVGDESNEKNRDERSKEKELSTQASSDNKVPLPGVPKRKSSMAHVA